MSESDGCFSLPAASPGHPVSTPPSPGRRCEGGRTEARRSFSLFQHLGRANSARQHRCRLFSAACDISAHLHRRPARFKIGSLVRDFSTSLLGAGKARHHLCTANEASRFEQNQPMRLFLRPSWKCCNKSSSSAASAEDPPQPIIVLGNVSSFGL